MFNGLRKIVGGKSEENTNSSIPDLLQTPVHNTNKKKKAYANGISNKKR